MWFGPVGSAYCGFSLSWTPPVTRTVRAGTHASSPGRLHLRQNRDCSLADGETLNGGLFLGEAVGDLITLLDLLGLLDAVELDVAVGGKVGADTTVGTVGTTTAIDGALNDDVVDDASVDIELGGLSVGLEVGEELTDALEGLLGPSTLGVLESLGLSVTADTTGVASEGDDLSVLETGLQVLDSLLQGPALHRAGDFVSGLVVSAKIGNSALSRYRRKRNEMRRVREKETTYTWQAQRAVLST